MRSLRDILIFLCLAIFLSAPRAAAVGTQADSSSVQDSIGKSYTLNEVIVTASRLPQIPFLSSSSATIITRSDIQKTNAVSLADVVSPLPGMFVKAYGGNSGLKTIAQRGLGPEHTLVLLNGMRVGNAQNGLVDLGLMSVEEVDGVEILHGGHSASFGSDAVAGVVNILSNRTMDARMLKVSSAVGSFGYRNFRAAGGAQISRLSFRLSVQEEKGEEGFPFVFRNGNERFDLTRRNADFVSRSAALRSTFTAGSDAEISLFARSFNSERGVGGPISSPTSISVSRQTDKDHLIQLHARAILEKEWQYRLGLQVHNAYERYRDPALNISGVSIDNYFDNTEWRFESSVLYSPGQNTRGSLGGEVAVARGEGNSLASAVHRTSYGVFAAVEQKIFDPAESSVGLLVHPSLRFDASTTNGIQLSQLNPQIGVALPFGEFSVIRGVLRASIGRNFRSPTFNELFYAGGGGAGNPNLQPERSTSVDAGGEITALFGGKHVLQCSFFSIEMENRIVWTAAGANVFPKNVRNVRSTGAELSYGWSSMNERLSLHVNYSYASAKKISRDSPTDPNINTQLIYVPVETGNGSLSLSLPIDDSVVRRIAATTAVHAVGMRYTTEDNQNSVPSYWLLNANMRTELSLAEVLMSVRVEVNNLLNTEYQNIISYPMPGRSFRVSMELSY